MRLILMLAALVLGPATPLAADEIRVAVAASVEHAVADIVQRFGEAHGDTVKLIVGSSGNLARQAVRGAPFDLFLSADSRFVDLVQQAGRTQGERAVYATGYLVLFVPRASALTLDGDLGGLAEAVRDGRLKRFAIANPDHAPYGVIAREALGRAGVWEILQPYLVTGTDAAQATQFVLSGAADAALLPASLGSLERVARAGRVTPVARHLYTLLNHEMTLLSDAPPAAKRLFEYLRGPAARAILSDHGFGSAADAGAP